MRTTTLDPSDRNSLSPKDRGIDTPNPSRQNLSIMTRARLARIPVAGAIGTLGIALVLLFAWGVLGKYRLDAHARYVYKTTRVTLDVRVGCASYITPEKTVSVVPPLRLLESLIVSTAIAIPDPVVIRGRDARAPPALPHS